MDTAAHVASVRSESQALLDVAAQDLSADVPSCPGWTMNRLVGHLGRTYDWVMGWIMTGESVKPRSAPRDDTVIAFTTEVRDQLVTVLDDLGREGTTTTWLGEQPVTFWHRRMDIETTLHRWDAENALGEPRPIAPELAVDAVDEMLQVLVPNRLPDELTAMEAAGATLHLHATDSDRVSDGSGEWLITFTDDGGLTVAHEHAKGDVAVRATASDLLLLLWNRAEPDRLEVFGDRDLLDRWRTYIRI